MDILFLSVSTGSGHIRAAEAIRECVEQKYPGSRALIVDVFKYINPVVDKLIVGSYLSALKAAPGIYGRLYRLSEAGKSMTDLSKTVNSVLAYRLLSMIKRFNPDAIVCTHPFPLQMVSNLKRKNRLDIPVIAVVTDFTNHLFWKHDNIDAFIVAHEYIKCEMIDMGIPQKSIYTYGIPVSEEFLHKGSRSEILQGLGLEDKLTVMLMGGSLGLGSLENIFKGLLKSKRDLQIIALPGKNKRLKRQLEEQASAYTKKVVIYDYTTMVSQLMDISDILITKPGGMTISEALVKRLPIFIVSPIPGQEEKNAHFLVNSGAAVRVLQNDNIDGLLCQTIDNPLRIKHMKEMAGYLACPDASRQITGLLEKLTFKDSRLTSSS